MLRTMHFIISKELFYFLVIGVFATVIDWFIFFIAVTWLGLHYQLGLTLATVIACTAHYAANKWFTFNCHSKNVASQFSVYILVVSVSLLCSMGIMIILVHSTPINNLFLRMITTVIMIIPNYLLHKYLTFNKRFFAQPGLSN